MIPNQEKTVNISGSSNLATARSEQMGIVQNSLPHLMRVLTNLYSDPEMAVIREISTNAYDSHVAAGKGNEPIWVQLPNVFDPEFIVTDFGVGLSEKEVFEVFGMYGASTKRESNDYVGQLGLGCKSPLTLTNQFSLTTVKDGVKCIFSVHLDEAGVGKITKMDESLTEESNGVEVSVPVSNPGSFVKKARRFYRFFPVMPKFVGSINFPEELVPETILEIDENIKVIKPVYDDENNDYVVMGGVAYPYRQGRRFRAGTVVMNAPIGAVDFTPSREDLHLTGRTREFIETQYSKVSAAFEERVKQKLSSAKDIFEFHSLVSSLYLDLNMLGIYTVNYKNLTLGTGNHYHMVLPDDSEVLTLTTNYGGNHFLNSQRGLRISDIENAAVVVNDLESMEINSYSRGRLKIWMIANSIKNVLVVQSERDVFSEYLKKFSQIAKLTDVRKSANKKISAKVTSKKYQLAETSGWNKTEAVFREKTPDESSSLPVVFAPKRVIKKMLKGRNFSDIVSEIQLFAVSVNQKSKFTSEFKSARQLDVFLSDKVNEILDSKRDEEASLRFAMSYDYSALDSLNLPYSNPLGSSYKTVKDQKLVKALDIVSISRIGSSKSDDYVKYSHLIHYLKTLVEDDSFTTEAKSLTKLIDKAATIGKTELDEAVALLKEMQKKYPLILHRYSKETYLVDYANMIAKGE